MIKKKYTIHPVTGVIAPIDTSSTESQGYIYNTYSDWEQPNYIKTIEKLDIWKILQQNDLSECVNKINEIIDTVNQLARR